MAELETRRLGLKELSTTYKTFDELVNEIKAMMTKADTMVLKVNWFIGLQAWIVQSNSVYGDHSVAELAERLGLATSTVYEAKRFYETYSREDLEYRLVPHGVPYRRALALLRCSDAEQRELIEEASYSLKLDDDEVAELVRRANKKEPLPKDIEGMTNLVNTMRSEEEGEDDDDLILDTHEGGIPVHDSTDDGEGSDNLESATADPNNERAGVKAIGGACTRLDKVLVELKEATNNLVNQLDNLSALTGPNYTKAEKRLIAMLDEVKAGMGALYMASKKMGEHNIVTRG